MGLQHISQSAAALTKTRLKNPFRPAPANSVRRADLRIVDSMARRAGHWGKGYVFPTQEKLVEWVQRDHGITYSRRHLNRHLAALERDLYIRRRTRVNPQTQRHTSTLYWIKARFFAALKQAARALYGMAHGPAAASSSIRVPRAAQHLRGFFKALHLPSSYPQPAAAGSG